MLLLWVLMNLSGYSQTTYPSKLIVGHDTVCAISLKQVRTINVAYVDLGFYKALSDSFRVILNQQEFIIKEQQKLTNTYDTQLRTKQSIIDNSRAEIVNYTLLNKKSQTQIKWLKVQRNCLAIGVAILALKIIFLK